MERKCKKCKETKPLSGFYKIGNGISGVRPVCKDCINEIERSKYGANADKRREKLEKQKARLEGDPEAKAAHMKRCRRWHLKTAYGMSLSEFDALLASQGGGCAICRTKPEEGKPKTRMVVDHCHETKRIRGILCDLCNTAIGKFEDNVDLLKSAINYLSK